MENQAKILILEDDESVRDALKAILVRSGFNVLSAAKPSEANDLLSENPDIDLMFCDCLLPQMTGIDFVKQAKINFPESKFKVVLMSGIYTDKAFIQESVQSTSAVAFVKKPFEVEQIKKIILKEGVQQVKDDSSARKSLYQMFSNPESSNRKKRKIIESIEEISGFDLPFLYSMLVETKSSGFLNIYNSDGSVSGISFCNGTIVGVDVDDRKTFLGEMLIQSGYALPQDVQVALRDKNNRKIGAYLIENNLLSPHAFDLILKEQMNIRLIKTIVDEKVRINFAATDVEMSYPSIDADSLTYYLHDWIASKITVDWLKSLYMLWNAHIIVKSPAYSDRNPALKMSLVKSLNELPFRLGESPSMQQLLEVKGYNEVAVYKAIHFLLTKGLIVFQKRSALTSPEEQKKVLSRVLADLKGKNEYGIVSYMQTVCGNLSGPKLFNEFLELMGEKPAEGTEALSVWTELYQLAEKSTTVMRDSAGMEKQKAASQKTEAEARMRANQLMEEAKKQLEFNQFVKAKGTLAEIYALYPTINQFYLYKAWASLGSLDPARRLMVLKEVEMDLMQVPADEKYDALYPFVSGLLLKIKGDIFGAAKSFEKSIALNGGFLAARRELSSLHNSQKKTDVFNMDLKDVMSNLFRKKK